MWLAGKAAGGGARSTQQRQISTSPHALTTLMWAACIQAQWGRAAKFIRKAYAFHPSKSCAAEDLSPTFWLFCSTMSALLKSAKAISEHRLPPAKPARSDCAKSVAATEAVAPNERRPIYLS